MTRRATNHPTSIVLLDVVYISDEVFDLGALIGSLWLTSAAVLLELELRLRQHAIVELDQNGCLLLVGEIAVTVMLATRVAIQNVECVRLLGCILLRKVLLCDDGVDGRAELLILLVTLEQPFLLVGFQLREALTANES